MADKRKRTYIRRTMGEGAPPGQLANRSAGEFPSRIIRITSVRGTTGIVNVGHYYHEQVIRIIQDYRGELSGITGREVCHGWPFVFYVSDNRNYA